MNVAQITEAVVAAYPSRQPLMFWGAPGLGKSSGVAQAIPLLNAMVRDLNKAEKRGVTKEETFGFLDLRLAVMDPAELGGVLFPDMKSKTMSWVTPDFLPTSGRGILFLDELVQATPSIQACASQLVLDRRMKGYVLPPGWHVVAAGNRVGDRAAANAMPTHIANRFIHLYPQVDVDAWVAWALKNKVDIRVIAFIKFRRALLSAFDPQSKTQAFPSPRSWEFVSKIITAFKGEREVMEMMIHGAVGAGAGSEFVGFLRVFEQMPSIDAILLSPSKAPIPTQASALFAVVTALSHRASADNLANVVTYFNRISDAGQPDFAIAAMKEISTKSNGALAKTRVFIEWAAKHNHMLA